MHLAMGVFRAIENRVPLARAVNTGLSALVDGNGEIRESLAKECKGVLSVTVPLDRRTSYYSQMGRLARPHLPGDLDRAGADGLAVEAERARPEQLIQYPQSHGRQLLSISGNVG